MLTKMPVPGEPGQEPYQLPASLLSPRIPPSSQAQVAVLDDRRVPFQFPFELPDSAAQGQQRFFDAAWFQRALEILPAAVALTVITSLIWGVLLIPVPLAIFILAFDAFWLWRSVNIGIYAVRGYYRMRRYQATDWWQEYLEAEAQGRASLKWEEIYHVVVIPTYKEPIEKLSQTLDSLAASQVADHIFTVIAMEEREKEAWVKAQTLKKMFAGRFAGIFCTFHPYGLPGEVVGKSSNEAWAARWAKRQIVDELGYDLDKLTVTSCDADTIFHPAYFSCLSFKFATDPNRYRRFWQGPIFLYNNIWDVPALLRIPTALSGLNHLSRLARCQRRAMFPQSTYSLSFKLAHDVGYWDADIIPEDWHMFLKCFFATGGDPEVDPIYLPVGNDGVRAQSYWRTFLVQYDQIRRHAWGVTDIPYAVRQFFAHPEIPLMRRLRRVAVLAENHILWSTQWFLVTIGSVVPGLVALVVVPDALPEWFPRVSRLMLTPCAGTLITLVFMDMRMRPPRPAHFSRWLALSQYINWLFMAPITFLFSALPSVDAQVRLMLGKRLEYRVTEKASFPRSSNGRSARVEPEVGGV